MDPEAVGAAPNHAAPFRFDEFAQIVILAGIEWAEAEAAVQARKVARIVGTLDLDRFVP